nr:MAG TPA: hypothetical protein [Caudoviricetes sp.]
MSFNFIKLVPKRFNENSKRLCSIDTGSLT